MTSPAYQNHPRLKETIDGIIENIKIYKFKFENDYTTALRSEKIGLTDFISTADLADQYKESPFFPENGFQNYMDYVQSTINLINSLYETSLASRQDLYQYDVLFLMIIRILFVGKLGLLFIPMLLFQEAF